MKVDVTKPAILMVHDEAGADSQIQEMLVQDYRVLTTHSVGEAKQLLEREQFTVMLFDLDLTLEDDPGGIGLLAEIMQEDPCRKVIMLAESRSRQRSVEAIDQGAYDCYTKPIDANELRSGIARAMYVGKLERENAQLRSGARSDTHLDDLIGSSAPMLSVFEVIRQVAGTDVTVLVQGESGTGKELVAAAIHAKSQRADKPFVPINCAAIPAQLLESELFGHEKGAFTGADRLKKGQFEWADEGTLFLDEIGELAIPLQAKLLRFLEQKEIQRVGNPRSLPVDVRVVAATNTDLTEAVAAGTVRTDLYYRLNVVRISLPPLRDRGEDVLLIAQFFLSKYRVELNRRLKGFSQAAIDAMLSFHWPGNVRELANRVRRAVILAQGDFIMPQDLELGPSVEGNLSLPEARDALEREYVIRSLAKHNWNISLAAQTIGVSRVTFYDLMKKHEVDPKVYKAQLAARAEPDLP